MKLLYRLFSFDSQPIASSFLRLPLLPIVVHDGCIEVIDGTADNTGVEFLDLKLLQVFNDVDQGGQNACIRLHGLMRPFSSEREKGAAFV